MPLLNYTTTIDAEQTIGEIQKLLSRHGVSGMMTRYEGAQVSAVAFEMNIDGKLMTFKLPCNWRAVREVFSTQGITYGKIKHQDKDIDNQAVRTAWRIIKDWIMAQLALVEVNMVTIPQVFLPYVVTKGGLTLSERMMQDPGFLLGEGK